jgi:hypothetical protein
MGTSDRPIPMSRRVVGVVWMAIEPAMAITLLIGIVAVTMRLTAGLPDARALAAISVPLALSCACWLLSVRLERRAGTQEYMLVELFLGLKGDLARAFPLRLPKTRERIEARTPLLRLTVQDFLEMARETPCAPTRAAGAWVALVLTLSSVERWAWHAVLHEGAMSLAIAAAIGPCLALFAIAFNDLRQGHVRSLGDLRRVRAWGEGYRPVPEPTIVPSTPTLILLLVPAAALGVGWTGSGSLAARLGITQVVFALWLLAWHGRSAATGSAFRRVERLASPVDGLLRRSLAPAWDLLLRFCRWGGWGSAALLALALSWPASLPAVISSTLLGVSAWLLTLSLMLGLLVLKHWRRPVTPVTCSARHLIGKQGERQVRRVSTFLSASLGLSMLLFVALGGIT